MLVDESKTEFEQMNQSLNKECQSCKNKGLNSGQWFMVGISSYILISSIYGTIKLVKLLIDLF